MKLAAMQERLAEEAEAGGGGWKNDRNSPGIYIDRVARSASGVVVFVWLILRNKYG